MPRSSHKNDKTKNYQRAGNIPVTFISYQLLYGCKSSNLLLNKIGTRSVGEYSGVGKPSPHDLRPTAITRAMDQNLTIRQAQMMSGRKDLKTAKCYDYHRENLDRSVVNFLSDVETGEESS